MKASGFSNSLLLTCLVCCLAFFAQAVQAQQSKPQEQSLTKAAAGSTDLEKKIEALLKAGNGFVKAKERVWVGKFKGESIGLFDIFVAVAPEGDTVVIGTVIARKENIKFSQELFRSLLEYNHLVDYVKVGIDEDGGLFLRVETSGRLLDSKELKILLDQVGSASEHLYGRIKDSMIAPR